MWNVRAAGLAAPDARFRSRSITPRPGLQPVSEPAPYPRPSAPLAASLRPGARLSGVPTALRVGAPRHPASHISPGWRSLVHGQPPPPPAAPACSTARGLSLAPVWSRHITAGSHGGSGTAGLALPACSSGLHGTSAGSAPAGHGSAFEVGTCPSHAPEGCPPLGGAWHAWLLPPVRLSPRTRGGAVPCFLLLMASDPVPADAATQEGRQDRAGRWRRCRFHIRGSDSD